MTDAKAPTARTDPPFPECVNCLSPIEAFVRECPHCGAPYHFHPDAERSCVPDICVICHGHLGAPHKPPQPHEIPTNDVIPELLRRLVLRRAPPSRARLRLELQAIVRDLAPEAPGGLTRARALDAAAELLATAFGGSKR